MSEVPDLIDDDVEWEEEDDDNNNICSISFNPPRLRTLFNVPLDNNGLLFNKLPLLLLLVSFFS